MRYRNRSSPLLLILALLLAWAMPSHAQLINRTLQTAASSDTGVATAMTVAGLSMVSVTVVGSAAADRVVTWKASQDGTNYLAVMCTNPTTLVQATTTTATGVTPIIVDCPVAGKVSFLAAVSGGAVGTVTVTASGITGVSVRVPSVGTPGVTLTSPHIATSMIFNSASGNYTLTWADPAAARAISFTDPGGTDSFVWLAATQAITGKTYNGLTVSTTTGTFTLTNAKTLTVSDSTTLATNAITLGGGEVITFSATNALSLLTTGGTSVTLPLTGTLATLAGAEEFTNKTLTSSVGKGTWTASGTWTLPAFTLGGTVSGGGQQLNNIIIGTSTPLAGTFTTLVGTGGTHTGITSLGIRDTSAAFDVTLAATSTSATLTAGRSLTLDMGNVAHTVALGTTANTITFPNAASGTVAMAHINNSFTAIQTITASADINFGGIKLATTGNNTGISMTNTSGSGRNWQLQSNYNALGDLSFMQSAAAGGNPTGLIFQLTSAGAAITGTLTATAIASSGAAQTGYLCYNTGAPGTITYDSGATCLVSLEEYKNNAGPITHASAIIDQLQPFWGSYKEGTPMADHHIQPFLGAHQVEDVDKRLVTYSDEGALKGVRYMNLTAVLVADMQEQHSKVHALEQRLMRLEHGHHD